MATILVTDDRPINRQFLVTLLGYRGHRVIEAGDGAQALKLVRAERPELVITDIVMPVMDGYQFLRALRCDPELSSTRVIVLSADYLEAEARALTRACGVSHFLTKPVEPAQMLAMVDLTLAEAPPRAIQEATLDEYVLKEHLRQLGSRLYQKVQELEARNEILDQQLGEHTRALAASGTPATGSGLAAVPPSANGGLAGNRPRDPLTGIYASGDLLESVESAMDSVRPDALPLGVLLIAIDDFREFREKFGILLADATLSAVEGHLRSSIRAGDILRRFGTEEFALVAASTPRDALMQLARTLQEGMRHLRLGGAPVELKPLTISTGTAVRPDDGATGAELIAAAREGLRRAKALEREARRLASAQTRS